MAKSELQAAVTALRAKVRKYEKAKRRLIYGEKPVRGAKKRNKSSVAGSETDIPNSGQPGGKTGEDSRSTNTKEDSGVR